MTVFTITFVFIPFFAGFPSISAVCKNEFEETVCENFRFSPETVLDSAANKLIIKNATGDVINENLAISTAAELIVKDSELGKIEPQALCFPNLTSLTFIGNRKIPKITKKVLKNCQTLKKIYLDGREIVVENGAFADATALQSLTLNETALPSPLQRGFFEGLNSLKSLTMRHSNIREIAEDAFDNLPNLKLLDLQNNEIEEIAPKTFRKLQQLKVLSLADNKLKNLIWDEFEGLKNLRVLYLERNNFHNVNVDKLVRTVPDLERIFLSYDKLEPGNRKQIENTLPRFNITFIYTGKDVNSD